MAITYPLSLPTSIGIAEIELRANNVVGISQSPFTFDQQIVQHQGQRWEASISLPAVRKDLSEPWVAFLLSLKGPVGTFLLGDPNMATPQGYAGTSAGTPLVNGAVSSGASEIDIDGVPANYTYLKAGDYFQLGSGSTATLHKVLVDADSDGTGACTIDFWPSVRRDIADGEAVVVSDAKGNFRLTSSVSAWSINNTSVYGISFDAVEAI